VLAVDECKNPYPHAASGGVTFSYVTYAGDLPVSLEWAAPWLHIRRRCDGAVTGSTWHVAPGDAPPRLAWPGSRHEGLLEEDLLAAIEATMQLLPHTADILVTGLPQGAGARLLRDGSAQTTTEGLHISRSAFWQCARPWLAGEPVIAPLQYQMTEGRRHPRRPPKPEGIVYRRYIPWLRQTFMLRTVDIEADLSIFNRWMNEPSVEEFWQESGDLARHSAYLERIQADARTTSLIGCLDGTPFSYFETYWAKEDRIAPFYDGADHDRGWHVLVGDPAYRGRRFLTAWMPSISHYLFLDDPRTQRLVIEPRADNRKMIRSLSRCGYACIEEFDFPHKRAMLGMLLRERFFDEAIWIPQTDPSIANDSPQAHLTLA
jgi:acetyl CoA:N6-hydroxylysine acetyl transferase